MSKKIEFTATFHGAHRVGSSVNGNPTWELVTSDGVFRTQSDASLGYSISNHCHRTLGWVGKEVIFTATPAGRVWGMRLAN